MSKTKWWVVALITILAVVVLAAGGYMLYRVGYSHGQQTNIVERRLPERFLDRFDREDKPLIIIPRLRMWEFHRGFLFPNRGVRAPVLFFRWGILPMAVIGILFTLVVVLAVVLITRRTSPPPAPPAPPNPLQPENHE